MSILIDGMEMPKGKPIYIIIDQAGQVRRYDLNNDKYEDDELFEAISVPPHGRLIDADVFTHKIKEEVNKCTATGCKADRYLIPGYIATMKFVNDLPIIISASEETST